MADGLFAESSLLKQLKDGSAQFELVASPADSVSIPRWPLLCSDANSHRFFARIGSTVGGRSPAMKKVEHYSIQRVAGDGRCLFRSLVKGMAYNKGISLSPQQERNDADELRMAVKELICDSEEERRQYEEALVAITVDESLKRYCQRIKKPDFWGGESELLVISRFIQQPITVYIPEHEHSRGGRGFIPIAEYGSEFQKGFRKAKKKQAVKLLYSGRNHYDLLV